MMDRLSDSALALGRLPTFENLASPHFETPTFSPAPPSHNPISEVPTALLHRPTAEARERGPLPDPVARRLAEWTSNPPRAELIPTNPIPRYPALSPAAICPDLFLVEASPFGRLGVAAELIRASTPLGQRVLVLTNASEALLAALNSPNTLNVARALAPTEAPERLPVSSAALTAAVLAQHEREKRRRDYAERLQVWETKLAGRENWEALNAERDRLVSERGAIPKTVELGLSEHAAVMELKRERETQLERVRNAGIRRTALEAEIAELQNQLQPTGGFFKRLFAASAKPTEIQPKLDALSAELRDVCRATAEEIEAEFQRDWNRLLKGECESRERALEERTSEISARIAALYYPSETPGEIRNEIDRYRTAIHELDSRAANLSSAAQSELNLVVGPLSALGHDPLLSATHPEVEPRFDRLIFLEAEELHEIDFLAAARLGAAWVLVGAADSTRPANGKPRPQFFRKLWNEAPAPFWHAEGERLVAFLGTEPLARQHRNDWNFQPLVSHPEIEARFHREQLVEVSFPANTTVAQARTFLANEADEVRIVTVGTATWTETGNALHCEWPLAVGNGTMVNLGNGIEEQLVGNGLASITRSLSFAISAGWTREGAESWVNERRISYPRSAVAR